MFRMNSCRFSIGEWPAGKGSVIAAFGLTLTQVSNSTACTAHFRIIPERPWWYLAPEAPYDPQLASALNLLGSLSAATFGQVSKGPSALVGFT